MAYYIHIEETDSTNNYIRTQLPPQTDEEIVVVHTDHQTAGKGQRGNSWESETGKNLLFSVLIHPHVEANQQFVICQLTSLAVKEVISQYTDHISIKWPNDIYWQDKKIGGILIENDLTGEHISRSIIGIGININQADFNSDAPNPVSLIQITSTDHNIETILRQIVARITFHLEKVNDGSTEYIVNEYKNFLFRKDGYHLYSADGHIFEACIKDIEASGILVLEEKDKTLHKYAFKEVKYIL